MSTIEIEAKAFKSCIVIACEVCIQEFVIEEYVLIIIQNSSILHDDSLSSVPINPFVYRIKATCFEFRNVEFSHVCRKGNVSAYLLAKHVLGIEDFSVWIEENPCFLEQTILHDVCIFVTT